MIPFIDLAAQQELIKKTLNNNLQNVLNHCQFVLGPEVKDLENKLAEYANVKHCIGVSSGTDALLAALMVLDIGPGDEVITSPFTFIATGEVISLVGAKPIFVDIDPKTYNLNPQLIEAAITEKTKAIMPVSLYGQCCDFDNINLIAEARNIPVIEDACQSFGGTYKGRKSCSDSLISTTSFFPSKPLGSYGDGGAIFTNDDHIAKVLREIINHGQDRRYHHPRLGFNGRLDTMQAAILLAKLEIFPNEVEQRNRIGLRYTELINDLCPAVTTPYILADCTSVYAQYTIQVDDRDGLQNFLKEKDIPTAVHYPVPLNKQPVFAESANCDVPVSEKIANRVISLPMHPLLSEENQKFIVQSIADFLN